MTLTAFFLIVLSAALHAAWNLIGKKNHMTIAFYLGMVFTGTLIWGQVQFWTPVRTFHMPFLFWLFLAGSVFSDLLYCTGLFKSYQYFEMSAAYPMMRSLPIVFTILFTTLFGIGKPLTAGTVCAMLIVTAGCLLMPLQRFSDLRLSNYMQKGIIYVLMTALGTTGYTVFDSLAQHVFRENAMAHGSVICSISYYSIRSISLTTLIAIACLRNRKHRLELMDCIRHKKKFLALAGIMATSTYVLVLLAMNYVSNVTYVQVFRQLGLPIGMALGILILKEKAAVPKYTGMALILIGLALTAFC